MMKITTILNVFFWAILSNTLFAEQYKPNGEITINTLEEWQNTNNWVRIAGGSGIPTNNDEIILSSNAKLNLNYNLKNDNLNVYLTFEDDGFLQVSTQGAVFVLGSIIMDKNNVEMKVFGDLEIEGDFQLDNGNLFVKDGGNLMINGNFLRTDIGSGQFEIGGNTTSFSVEGYFDDQHNSPYVYNAPYISIKGSCSTKSGTFCSEDLPVVLTAFNVTYSHGNAVIRWSTASEQNNKLFEIYRSKDLVKWELIAKVEGQGNSYFTHQYQWTDTHLNQSGRNYYQLHQIDFDGAREVFETLVLEVQHQSSLPEVLISTNSISSGESVQVLYRNEKFNSKRIIVVHSDGKVIDCTEEVKDLIPNQTFSTGINILLIYYGREKYTFKILK
ncbi:hypothetical protein IC221_25730 [Flammeovirga sp. EKP202]|nr:hypothetical protein [Flammeovirga sp. EKP202]